MIPSTFNYHAPTTLDEAISLLGQYGEDGKILAGGHSLLPMMKLRFAEPEHLIDINRIDSLRGIREEKGIIHIGAMTTESELIASDILNEQCPIIPEAAKVIADPQIRNRGTLGGDIAHGDPGNDHPSIMLALDANFVLTGPNGERTVPANGFFIDTFFTQLEEGEILTEIQVPVFSNSTGSAYTKLKRKTGDFATAASAVVIELDGNTCKKITIALTNVGPTAFRATSAEDILTGKEIDNGLVEEAAQAVMEMCNPTEDPRGDVEYKTHMAAEMTRRSINQAQERARG
ncbi:MAG: xanthine dehydrogenase family protein subunit M [Proteobacteria bacterium]|nr:xanthine dehydrogenase family protein subunit M [Pseudomonadota bacterium]